MIVPPVMALVLASMPLSPLHVQTQPVRVVNDTVARGIPPSTAAPSAARVPATSDTRPRS